MSPKELVERWVELFNAGDADALAELYHEDAAILEWRDPLGLRGCGCFTVREGRIAFQRGYWDKLSFLRLYRLPIAPD